MLLASKQLEKKHPLLSAVGIILILSIIAKMVWPSVFHAPAVGMYYYTWVGILVGFSICYVYLTGQKETLMYMIILLGFGLFLFIRDLIF